MSADRDYLLQKELVRLFVSTDSASRKAQEAIFYVHAEGLLLHYEVGLDEKESKVMKEVRRRFQNGRDRVGEPSKFYQYFLTKFRRDIERQREKVKMEKYGYRMGIG